MLLNDVGPFLTAVQFQLSMCDGCRSVYNNTFNPYLKDIFNPFYFSGGLMDDQCIVLLV